MFHSIELKALRMIDDIFIFLEETRYKNGIKSRGDVTFTRRKSLIDIDS